MHKVSSSKRLKRSWYDPTRSSRGMSKAYNSTSYSGMHRYCWWARIDLLAVHRTNKPSDLQYDWSERETYAQESNERTEKDGGTGGGGGGRELDNYVVDARAEGIRYNARGRTNNRRRARRSLVAILLVHLFADRLFVFCSVLRARLRFCASRRRVASRRVKRETALLDERQRRRPGKTRRRPFILRSIPYTHVQLPTRSSLKLKMYMERTVLLKL